MNPISRKIRLLLVPAIVLLAGRTTPALAQSTLDGFDPNANGLVEAVLVQPDGKIVIAGSFTTLAPNGGASVTRNRIARLNSNGTLDTSFNPNANGIVWSLALQPDGKILAGGEFTTIGGQSRNRIARLDPVAGLADSFNPDINSVVRAITPQLDGKILVGGGFTSVGGQTRNRIARLDSSGSLDSFDPNASGLVLAIVPQNDGKILVGGLFNTIGGQTRNNIARLNPSTGLADSFDPIASSIVFAIATQADGKILAGGGFTTIGGQTRNHIARLDPATGLADSFNPNANDFVYSIVVQSDGQILVGGAFNGAGANTIGGHTRNRIARLNPITGLADSFDPNSNNEIYSIAIQPDGRVLAGGAFASLTPNDGAAVPRNRIARLEIDGRVDQTPNLMADGQVKAFALQADGKILIGGSFQHLQGASQAYLARLNTDGTVDFGFEPFPNGEVRSIAIQADGKIIVGGEFGAIGSAARHRIARLLSTGFADSFDAQFDPDNFARVDSLVLQPDGRILVGGDFSTIGGQTRNNIARLNPSTGLADSFNPNANGSIYATVVQADGKILAGGNFTTIGGQPRNRVARLDPSNGLADSFNPNANTLVDGFALQPDGKILVGGAFTSIGGQNRKYIARLDPGTGLADSFDPDDENIVASTIAVQADGKVLVNGFFSDPFHTHYYGQIRRLDPATGLPDSFYVQFETFSNGGVGAIALQTDGKILAGGDFVNPGVSLDGFLRFTNDTAAQQNLAVTQSNVTWIRGGSSPQFGRVTFEVSTDNVNYNLLGDATPSGSNWTLTGLALPTQQNLYIRARGRSGISDLDSTIESVRNIFLTLPPAPTQVVSRKLHGGTPFDIPLPLTGSAGIECRSGGANNDYQIVFTFPNAVTFTNASVTAGIGSVSGSSGSGTSTVVLNLTSVANAQRITVTLFGVSDGTNTGELGIPMGVLLGDTNGNGSVNASDVSQTKLRSGQTVDASNFRTDVTVSNSINAGDVSIAKLKTGTALP